MAEIGQNDSRKVITVNNLEVFQAGRPKNLIPAWKEITSNFDEALDTRIEVVQIRHPIQMCDPRVIRFNHVESESHLQGEMISPRQLLLSRHY